MDIWPRYIQLIFFQGTAALSLVACTAPNSPKMRLEGIKMEALHEGSSIIVRGTFVNFGAIPICVESYGQTNKIELVNLAGKSLAKGEIGVLEEPIVSPMPSFIILGAKEKIELGWTIVPSSYIGYIGDSGEVVSRDNVFNDSVDAFLSARIYEMTSGGDCSNKGKLRYFVLHQKRIGSLFMQH